MLRTSRRQTTRRPAIDEGIKFFVGLDVHKDTIAIAVAEAGRAPAQLVGSIAHDVPRLLKRLARYGNPAQSLLFGEIRNELRRLSFKRIGGPVGTTATDVTWYGEAVAFGGWGCARTRRSSCASAPHAYVLRAEKSILAGTALPDPPVGRPLWPPASSRIPQTRPGVECAATR